MSGWQEEARYALRDVAGLTAEEDDAIIAALALRWSSRRVRFRLPFEPR